VLGPTDDVPPRTLPVMRAVSPVRFFDADLLELARWISTRYVTPLAEALGALSPPRVRPRNKGFTAAATQMPVATEASNDGGGWRAYARGSRLARAIGRRRGVRRASRARG
jgi:primosomal protein N'